MRQFNIGGSVGGCRTGGGNITYAGEMVPAASAPQAEEEIIYLTGDDEVPDKPSEKRDSLINPEGKTLEERFYTPEGYTRIPREMGSFQGYLRRYVMKPDQSPGSSVRWQREAKPERSRGCVFHAFN